MATNLDRVLDGASPAATAEVTRLLDSPRFADSPALTAAALGELSARAESAGAIDTAAAVAVTSSLTAAGAGDGLARLESSAAEPLAAPALARLATGTEWRTVDSGLRAANREELPTIARLLGVVREARPARPSRRPSAAKKPSAAKGSRKRKKAGERT